MKTLDKFFLLAGSISTSTDNLLIDRAHDFVKVLVGSVLASDGGLVVYLASEPINEDGKSMTFDWTVVREVNTLLPLDSLKTRLRIVTSTSAQQNKMNQDQRMVISRLVARNIAEVIHLDDDTITGGNIGDEQTDVADAMIALGGGKGVLDRARKMVKQQRPVFALDLQLGANSEDGKGALQIQKAFIEQPLTYFPFTGEAVKRKIQALTLQEPVYDLNVLAQKVIDLFGAEFQAKHIAAPPDVLVLTALSVELAAAKLAFGVAEDSPAILTSAGVHTWRASIQRSDGGSANCILATLGGAGNVGAAATTAMLLVELRPKHVLMLGIAAGMRGKCKLGEVVLSERVVAYEGAAVLEGGKVETRPEISRPNFRVRQDMSSYLASSLLLADRLARTATTLQLVFPTASLAGDVSTAIKPSPATIASGELLIRDPAKFRMMRDIHGKTEVLEMEAAGIFEACEQQNVPILVVRGISDFGDSLKDNAFHEIAAKAAAIVTADYVAHGLTLN